MGGEEKGALSLHPHHEKNLGQGRARRRSHEVASLVSMDTLRPKTPHARASSAAAQSGDHARKSLFVLAGKGAVVHRANQRPPSAATETEGVVPTRYQPEANEAQEGPCRHLLPTEATPQILLRLP